MVKQLGFNRRGFTLIEVIVVAAIIAILAGILVPMIFNQIDESKKTRAIGDAKAIQTAFLMVRKEGGKWPIYGQLDACANPVDLLFSDGVAPTNAWAGARSENYKNTLKINSGHPCFNNANTIQAAIIDAPADPWGNQYLTSTLNFANPGNAVWVISAGPNGIVETNENSGTLNDNPAVVGTPGDDIGIRIQ